MYPLRRSLPPSLLPPHALLHATRAPLLSQRLGFKVWRGNRKSGTRVARSRPAVTRPNPNPNPDPNPKTLTLNH